MAFRPLKSFLPTADDVVNSDLPTLGGILLRYAKGYEGLNTVMQQGRLNQKYLYGMLENCNLGLGLMPAGPEYGGKELPEVMKAVKEAWNWLERGGMVIRDPEQPVEAGWFLVSREGERLAAQLADFERFGELGLDRVQYDLNHYGGVRQVGGGPLSLDTALKWVRLQENTSSPTKQTRVGEELIAETRLAELRGLQSSQFDFTRLIRLCEELNVTYREECYFATAMLTRSLLDHVPPVFDKVNFGEVANNYGPKSFKGIMQHLHNASRNVADGHLHQHIRKCEIPPTAQQVNCGQQLDALLAEVIRVIRGKEPQS